MLSKMIGFLLIPLYTRYLEPVDYGMLEMLVLTVDVLSLVLGLQLIHAVAKFHDAAETPEAKRRVISTSILMVAVLAILFYVSLSFFADNLSSLIFDSTEFAYLFQTIFITSVFGIITQIPLLYIRIQDRSKLFVVITLIQVLLTVCLTIWMVVFLEMSVFGVLLANAIVSGFVCLALLYSTIKSVGIKHDVAVAKEMVIYSAPLIPGVIGLFVLNSSDRFFLNELGSLEEVGLYAIGYKFGFLISPLLIGPFLLVWSAKMFEVYRHPDRDEVLNKVLSGLGFLLVFCALGLSIFIEEVLQLMTTPQYYAAAVVVPFIAFAYVMSGLARVMATPLYAEKKTGAIGYIHSSAAVVCLILNYILIQQYGIVGAAVATLLSFSYVLIVTFVVSQRFSTVRWEWRGMVKLIVVAVLVIGLGRLIVLDSLLLNLLYKSTLMVTFLVVLVLVGFVKLHDIKAVVVMIQKRQSKKG
ncbi:MAG: oligosaccharide flippase family protein [Gammaproteobacteria bacterium]|nr:oligosaccharide flippase family protein [Gammaproteobacteria bacterium]